MTVSVLRTAFAAAALISALALAGCNGSLEDIAPKAAQKGLPPKLVAAMQAKSMSTTAPIMVRIFKEEAKLEVWKQKSNGRYDLVTEYDICKFSGKLGPKYTKGDRQAPEGFYTVTPAQMNPNSSYHLSFNLGFPNAYDRANGRTGEHLMVHGACSSSGCYSMTDAGIEQIFAFAREAFKGGQQGFQVQAFPFRMTAENMARYKEDPNFKFWQMLKQGYDHFELTKTPPKVDVCDKRYVFNSVPQGESEFRAAGACPAAVQPDTLVSAYKAQQSTYESAFAKAMTSKAPAPKPSILGVKEANLVAEWSKKRARGERVTMEPPVLAADGQTVVQTTERMGRLKSAIEAEERTRAVAEAKRPKTSPAAAAPAAKSSGDAETMVAAVPTPAVTGTVAKAEAVGATPTKRVITAPESQTASAEPVAPVPTTAAMAQVPQQPSKLKKLFGLFGG